VPAAIATADNISSAHVRVVSTELFTAPHPLKTVNTPQPKAKSGKQCSNQYEPMTIASNSSALDYKHDRQALSNGVFDYRCALFLENI
jgi:hypothetical protein